MVKELQVGIPFTGKAHRWSNDSLTVSEGLSPSSHEADPILGIVLGAELGPLHSLKVSE